MKSVASAAPPAYTNVNDVPATGAGKVYVLSWVPFGTKFTIPPALEAAVKVALPSAKATGVATMPEAPKDTGAAVTAPVVALMETV
jgi:hypothetical protein